MNAFTCTGFARREPDVWIANGKRGQRAPVPLWAMNDRRVTNVVAAYLERRAGIGKADGSSAERIRRSEDRLWAQLPALERRMKNLIAECRATYALLENGVRQLPSYHPDLR